jgi:hypothetical protein
METDGTYCVSGRRRKILMSRPKSLSKESLWLEKLVGQVRKGKLDVEVALNLAFYQGQLVKRQDEK